MRMSHTLTSDLRVGDAERDQALSELGRHFAEGRLTPLEHEERSSAAIAARTQTDLDALFADLPILENRRVHSNGTWRKAVRRSFWIAFAVVLAAAALRLGPVIAGVALFFAVRRWRGSRLHSHRHGPCRCSS